jgi:hypothetical protein
VQLRVVAGRSEGKRFECGHQAKLAEADRVKMPNKRETMN